MPEPSRLQAERDRQTREKRLFLSVAGIGFAASMLAAVALGHRRAHKKAIAAGESIQENHVKWAIRAFGLGTLYAVGFVGITTAAASYYLQQEKGVSTTGDLSDFVRQRVARTMGPSLMDRLGINSEEDRERLDRIDRMVSETNEQTGEKKIKFARIKRLVGSDQEQGQESVEKPEQEEVPDKRLSVGARMRRAFGFGPSKKPD